MGPDLPGAKADAGIGEMDSDLSKTGLAACLGKL